MARTWLAMALVALAAACASSPPRNGPMALAPAGPAPVPGLGDVRIEAGFGGGRYEHDTQGDNGTASDTTDGGLFQLRAEFVGGLGMGAGLALEASGSDDDLFRESGIADGEGSTTDLYLYFVGVPAESPSFRFPIRAGPYLHNVHLEENTTPTEIDWSSLGLRIEVEPEVWFLQQPGFALGIGGDLSLGAHWTSIDVESPLLPDDFDGNGATFGLGFGLRALIDDTITAELGYLFRTTLEDQSDTEGGVAIRDATASFRGVVLGVGVRF